MSSKSSSKPSSFKDWVIAMIVVSLLAGGAGFFEATVGKKSSQTQAQKEGASLDNAGSTTGTQGGEAKSSKDTINQGVGLFDIPPIVTNIRSPAHVWVRLEVTMMYDRALVKTPETMAAQIASDFLVYMRTISLEQMEGAVGFLHIKADLNERAAVRSQGAVKEIIFRTLVVQ